jgi:hypothetical protein
VADSLRQQGLRAAPEADRTTLLRRLSLDLIGLPPSPEEAAAFLAEDAPDAYERKIDSLLASPHYGERLAMWWLDLVRYADTVGYHGDQPISASPFRDYVIQSFQRDQPFDQFTIEQLAGDLLPEPTLQQRIASGYNRLGMMSAEGGVQPKEYLAKYIAERVRNASGTWLGITLGCAECHDHKFDPFSTRDFYRMEAFFADIRERGLYDGPDDERRWGSFVKVPTTEQAEQLTRLDREIAALQQTLATETPELTAAQTQWEQQQPQWTYLHADALRATEGTVLQVRPDGAILASGANPETTVYELTFTSVPGGITALRLEVLPDDSLPQHGPGRASNGNFVLTEITATTQEGAAAAQSVALQNPSASYEQTGAAGGNPYGKWAIAAALDGDVKGKTWGWAVMEQAGKPNAAVIETAQDLTLAQGATLTVRLEQNHGSGHHTLGCFRLSVTTAQRPLTAATLPKDVQDALAVPAAARDAAQATVIATYFRSIAPSLTPVREQLAAVQQQRKEHSAQITATPVAEATEPRTIRVLRRGNWMDEGGEVVTPGFPAALPQGTPTDRRLSRLDLARWLTAKDNPLTARVFVNRIWKLLFGAGLARKLDDLGAQGERPTHPELLDFLAADFRDHGYSVKRLLKSIVLSRTYRQSSAADAVVRERDPDNRWLARQGRFRLDAELVRDNALMVSGLLVTTIGGRSVFPYQPTGYWSYLNFPTRDWPQSSGDALYRRGLYTHWQRQYLHPSMLAFDAPSREECTAERARSNTPLQSLTLLNDPSHVEAARAFAERIVHLGPSSPRGRIDWAFQRALTRNASDAEAAVLTRLLATQTATYRQDPTAAAQLLHIGARPPVADIDPVEIAAWTTVARTILNLHEVVTRN